MGQVKVQKREMQSEVQCSKDKRKRKRRGAIKDRKKVYKSLVPYPQPSLIKPKGRAVRKKEKGHKTRKRIPTA